MLMRISSSVAIFSGLGLLCYSTALSTLLGESVLQQMETWPCRSDKRRGAWTLLASVSSVQTSKRHVRPARRSLSNPYVPTAVSRSKVSIRKVQHTSVCG